MKNILILAAGNRRRALAAAFTLTLGLGACHVTDVVPVDSVSEAVAYSDASHVALSVTGVYDAAQSGFYNGNSGGSRGYPFGAAANEQGDVRGEDVADEAGFFAVVFQNSITAASPNITYMWANCYAVANKANVAIAGIQQAATGGIITASDELVYEGELRFLRALAHLELVLNFARPYTDGNGSNPGVPYRTVPNNTVANVTTSAAQDRGTVADDYTQMLADLDFAETNLPTTRSGLGSFGSVTRATKGAAIALKQRIRLYQGNWAAAITEGNKLITGTTTFTSPIGSYMLMPTQRAAFPGGTAVTVENIFSVENSSTDNPGVNGALANVYGSSAAAPTGIAGRALLAVSPNLYNAPFFTCSDLRRTVMMQQDGGLRTAYVLKKYTDAVTSTDFAPIIRYAEVLLNQAEAQARTGNSAVALNLLNAVRNRSVATTDQYATGSLTGTGLVQAILNERRVELVGEGFRWGDISRLAKDTQYAPIAGGGIPAKFNGQLSGQVVLARYGCGNTAQLTGQAIPAVAYSSPLFLWPIPSSETQTNPVLAAQQNPGY
ncbi:RagB/SusD family nutrient uptake outer membrane protein [Hymenobacter caeli]|uniref:RagB/SusD family nutrient uptake outer membrane protein n=1 Tax=Hymenobacter caeli TaxID=2735894 RepID=A0ABX2FPD3_9BACT|nr:RagB/SusD family nutrient uptake outer membrane protein [Hymenobacter caeli]NRT19036.1 hypothetical protein [Hymenobacter caeli]